MPEGEPAEPPDPRGPYELCDPADPAAVARALRGGLPEQVERGCVQSRRDLRQGGERDVALAALDVPDIGPVEPAGVRERLLGEASGKT